MVNEKFIIENKKPVETVYELKDEYKIPSFEEFNKTYKGGVNYADLNSGDIGTNKGYDPTNDGANCYKYCYYCRKDVSVSSYSSTYCPHCGTMRTISRTIRRNT